MCPKTIALTFLNDLFLCVVRKRLDIVVVFDGPEPRGCASLRSNKEGRLITRHAEVLAGWRQILVEAGGSIPDRNVERQLARAS
eukprot:1228414-Pyramimonas_sp.AAC.1